MNEAEQLIVSNQVEAGMAILNGLLYDEPGYAGLHNHLGWAHLYYTSNMPQAEIHLKAALKFHPQMPAPYLHLAHLYVRTERNAAALDIALAGLEKPGANRPVLLEVIGHVYEARHEFRKAIRAYRDASLASMAGPEINNLHEHIKRCRRKRWIKLVN